MAQFIVQRKLPASASLYGDYSNGLLFEANDDTEAVRKAKEMTTFKGQPTDALRILKVIYEGK